MYCRLCGNEVHPNAEICVSCGCRPLAGDTYCQECGTETRPDQEYCIECGTVKTCYRQKKVFRKRNTFLVVIFIASMSNVVRQEGLGLLFLKRS